MKYAILRTRHQNARYDASLDAVTMAELTCIAEAVCAKEVSREIVSGLSLFTVQADEDPRLLRALFRTSCAAAVFSLKDGALYPLMEGLSTPAFYDMASILKYKGKTNETFTRALVNIAAFSCDRGFDERLTLLDPLAGKGTTLYCALSMGYDSCGIENDKKEVAEAVAFTKSYLKNGRFKHGVETRSATKNGKPAGSVTEFVTAPDADSYKKGDTLMLSMALGDAADCSCFYRKHRPDIVVADLPYGIQHEGDGGRKGAQTLGMMRRILPNIASSMKPGGAVAFSFNSYTLKKDELQDVCASCGLVPITGGWADGLKHWVEQAVMRDVVTAKKPSQPQQP